MAAAESERYTGVAIILHWVIAALILGQIAGGVYMSGLPDGSAQQFSLYQLHKSFGITILLLSLARLGWRLGHRPPPLPAATAPWQKRIARGVHIAFYGLMIGVPIGGWALVSASPFADSVPTYLFGVIPWPHMPFFSGIEDRKALADGIAELHEIFAFLMGGLVVLHVGAALKHHFVDRDGVLQSMAPFVRRSGKAS